MENMNKPAFNRNEPNNAPRRVVEEVAIVEEATVPTSKSFKERFCTKKGVVITLVAMIAAIGIWQAFKYWKKYKAAKTQAEAEAIAEEVAAEVESAQNKGGKK